MKKKENKSCHSYSSNKNETFTKSEKYFQQLNIDIKKKKQSYSKTKLMLITNIVHNSISISLSLISIFIYIARSHILIMAQENHYKEFNQYIQYNEYSRTISILFFIEFALTHIFFTEFIFLLFKKIISSQKISSDIILFGIIEVGNLIVCYISLYITNMKLDITFIRILRLYKIFNLRNSCQQLQAIDKEKSQFLNDAISYKAESKTRQQLLKLINYLISMTVLISGIIQQISLFNPSSFSLEKMSFIDSFYYTVINLSTVGTGDIVPTMTATRFFMLFIILFFVFLIAQQITVIATLFITEKSRLKHYYFTDHIIIFGDISNDNRNQIHLINFFDELYSNALDNCNESGENPKLINDLQTCILITADNDIDSENTLGDTTFYSKYSKLVKYPLFGIKIFQLSVKNYDWEAFTAANFRQAKAIFCLNYNLKSNFIITDRLITFFVRNLESINDSFEKNYEREDNPHFKIKKSNKSNSKDIEAVQDDISVNKNWKNFEFLNSKKLYIQFLFREKNFKEIIHKNIYTQYYYPRMRLKYSLIAKNIFVRGWVTFITNLLNRKIYLDNPKIENYYLGLYFKGLNQRLRIFKFPLFLHKMLFKDCLKIIYSSSIAYINHIKNSQDIYNYNKEEKQSLSETMLIGVLSLEHISTIYQQHINYPCSFTKNDYEEYSWKEFQEWAIKEELSTLIKKISYNPLNIQILENDFGIFITSFALNFEDYFLFLERNLDKYREDIMSLPKREKNEKVNIADVKVGSDSSINIPKNNSSKDPNIVNKTEDLNIENELNLLKNEDNLKSNETNLLLSQYFTNNFLELISFLNSDYTKNILSDPDNRYFPIGFLVKEKETILENHILILGWNVYMEHLITKIRTHAMHNTIVLIAEDIPKDIILLRNFPNVYIARGDYLDLNILINLKISKALYAIIITNKTDINNSLEDSKSVLAARIIAEHFKIPYLIEIADSSSTRFLGQLPYIANESNKKDIIKCSGKVSPHSYEMAGMIHDINLFPNFFGGKILFNCIFDRMIARSLNHNYEIACLKELIELDSNKENETIRRVNKGYRKSEKHIRSNPSATRRNTCTDTHMDYSSEVRIFSETEIKIFSFPIEGIHENKLYRDLVYDLISLDMIPLGVFNKRTRPMVADDILSTKSPTILIGENIPCSESKKRNYSNFLRHNLDQHVLEYVDLNDTYTPSLISNPSSSMVLNKDMEVVVIGKYNKMTELTPMLSKDKFSGNKFNEKIEKMNLCNNKFMEIKCILKEIEDKISNLNLRRKII